MNFSAYSIKNPLVAILLFTLLMIGGIFGFYRMKVQQFPDIDFPAVVVTVGMSGAAPAQLESDVAKKLENQLAGIQGIKSMRTTIATGAVTVASEFRLEKDLNEALDDVRSAVSEVRSDLPAAAAEPIVTKVSAAGFPVVSYSVQSKDMTEEELSWWIDDTLKKQLSDLVGVGKVERIGGLQRQILVEPTTSTLSAFGLPITNLSRQIGALWQDLSGGGTKMDDSVQTIRVLGTDNQLQGLKQLSIRTPSGTAKLADLAQVSDTTAERQSQALLNGESVVAFQVTRTRGASEVAMVAAIDQTLKDIQAKNPKLSIQKIYDHAEPIEEDYHASLQMLIEGCVLAVIVVFLFLRDWRATLVTAAALPLSIIPTFLAMYWFGFSLNVISLLALSLVIGVLVDDAIVEIENIVRHLDMGKTPFEAAMEAADEIGLAVVATTLTLIAVFLPTAFMSGVVGQFFRQFGWTASLAIFVSLLVARLITPMMAAYILKPRRHHVSKEGAGMAGYIKLVRWVLAHRGTTLVLTVLLFVASLSLAKFLPATFIPNDNANETQVSLSLAPEARLEDTLKVAQAVADKVKVVEGVDSVFVSVGSGQAQMGDKGGSGHGSVTQASLQVKLLPRAERPDKTQIEHDIRMALTQVAGTQVKVGLSAGGEAGYAFSLTSSNPALLGETVNRVVGEIQSLGGVKVSTNQSLPKPEIAVRPDSLAMAERGVNAADIADTLRVATVGDYDKALAKMNFDSRQLPIVVKLPEQDKQSLGDLLRLYVPAGNQTVQLAQVASIENTTGESEIFRFNRERAVKILVESSLPLGELAAKVKATPTLAQLPSSVGLIEEGQAENMNELFLGFVVAMGVGIFCIFGVLVLLFHRILQPFTILVALPLSIGGAFLGLILTKSSLSMPSMIGLIMLMGIATKNSILLVDYAIIAQEAGKSQLDAILDACKKRARPIIMTTIAMGAGMLPLVLGLGEADPTFRRPMAAAVLGGLMTSTLLSLVVVPVVYTLMDDLSFKMKRLMRAD